MVRERTLTQRDWSLTRPSNNWTSCVLRECIEQADATRTKLSAHALRIPHTPSSLSATNRDSSYFTQQHAHSTHFVQDKTDTHTHTRTHTMFIGHVNMGGSVATLILLPPSSLLSLSLSLSGTTAAKAVI